MGLNQCTTHYLGMKKLQNQDEFKKFASIKKRIGIESQNVCKQFNDQKTIETRWNSILWLLLAMSDLPNLLVAYKTIKDSI